MINGTNLFTTGHPAAPAVTPAPELVKPPAKKSATKKPSGSSVKGKSSRTFKNTYAGYALRCHIVNITDHGFWQLKI